MKEIFNYCKLRRKYNKLSLEYESLQKSVKNKCFETLLNKIGEPEEIKRLKRINRKLREQIKELKKVED